MISFGVTLLIGDFSLIKLVQAFVKSSSFYSSGTVRTFQKENTFCHAGTG